MQFAYDDNKNLHAKFILIVFIRLAPIQKNWHADRYRSLILERGHRVLSLFMVITGIHEVGPAG